MVEIQDLFGVLLVDPLHFEPENAEMVLRGPFCSVYKAGVQ